MIIKNGNVFQEDGSFRKETLYIRNHRLTEAFEATAEEEVIDAEGLMVIPGLVDIHSHGAYGEDFSDGDPEGLKKRRCGGYHFLPVADIAAVTNEYLQDQRPVNDHIR